MYHPQFSLFLGAWGFTDQRPMRIRSHTRSDTSQVQEEATRTKSGLFSIHYQTSLCLSQEYSIIRIVNWIQKGVLGVRWFSWLEQPFISSPQISVLWWRPLTHTVEHHCLITHYIIHCEWSPGLSRECWENGCCIFSMLPWVKMPVVAKQRDIPGLMRFHPT